MNIGTVNTDNVSLDTLIKQRRVMLGELASKAGFNPKLQDLMPLDEYLYAVGNRRALAADVQKQATGEVAPQHRLSQAQREFVSEAVRMDDTPDALGWRRYLDRRCPEAVKNALKQCSQASTFPEASRRKHTLIFGPSDWGKSELVKALLYHYAEEDSAAVIVLDPGGDLSKQVARWPELVRSDRLRLIQPGLEGGYSGLTVGINPLDGRGLGVEDRRVIAGDWADTLGVLSNDLTTNMQLLVMMSVQVLLAFPGGVTLDDLCRLLLPREKAPRGSAFKRMPPKDERTTALLAFALNYEVGQVAEFFRHEFDTESVENTRWALLRRLKLVLNYPHAQALLTGEATLDLEKEIEARKFIVVDLSRFKKHGSRAVGRFFVALLASIGRRRESLGREDRTPTHLFIDEASTMVSAHMLETLKEMRKFGVYLTLVQQVAGDEMTPAQQRILRLNTGCKLIAPANALTAWVDVPDGYTVPEIGPGEFLASWAAPRGEASTAPQKLVVRSDLADDRHGVSAREWRALLERITGPGGYYRSAALAGPSAFDAVPWETDAADVAPSPAPPPPRRSAGPRRAPPAAAPPADVPDDVPPELAGRFTSATGLKGDF